MGRFWKLGGIDFCDMIFGREVSRFLAGIDPNGCFIRWLLVASLKSDSEKMGFG